MHGTPLRGKRVVVQHYGETNRDLQAELESEGAEIIEIVTYRWGLGEAAGREVRRRGAIDDRRNDAGRQEGEGSEQADVPFALGLTRLTGEVHITGPVTKQEKVKWDRLRNRKHECLVEIRELKELQKEMPDDKFIQSEIEFEQRIYGIISKVIVVSIIVQLSNDPT